MERIAHDNLVRLYELDEDALGPFFTMEYVAGSSMRGHCDAHGKRSNRRQTAIGSRRRPRFVLGTESMRRLQPINVACASAGTWAGH
jgi:hypothetical protein